jgi:multidrug efflux pump subunit AcrA (membrane-fusion protein)
LIEHVQRGQLAHVRIVALDSLNPVVDGVVATISADQITNPNPGEAYFTVRLYINKQSLAKLKYKRISAGMPVEVLFKTGERTFFQYLLEPLLKTFFFALRE